MTDFEIFGIVDMGERRSDDDRETEKVAQLQFLTNKKKSELKSSEMRYCPAGANHSQQARYHVGAHTANPHDTRLGRGRCPYDPEFIKTKRGQKENMKDENKRDLYLKVRVSQAEMDAIKKKFANSGMNTLSGFVRAMIFEGYIVHIDENELKRLNVLANNIANNINQIAHRANVTNKVYKEDIEDIKSLADQLIQPLLFLQSKCLQLKH